MLYSRWVIACQPSCPRCPGHTHLLIVSKPPTVLTSGVIPAVYRCPPRAAKTRHLWMNSSADFEGPRLIQFGPKATVQLGVHHFQAHPVFCKTPKLHKIAKCDPLRSHAIGPIGFTSVTPYDTIVQVFFPNIHCHVPTCLQRF